MLAKVTHGIIGENMDTQKKIEEIVLHCTDLLISAGLMDEDGRIIPRDGILLAIEKEYPEKPDYERWTMAQKQTLIEWWTENANNWFQR